MGKSSRNARNSLTKTFARLQNTGKSIFAIAMIAKSDPMTVYLHFAPDGDGRRRNEGFVPFLRKNGAHWSIIAAAQGMSYEEIKEFDRAGTRPSGPWLQGSLETDSIGSEAGDEVNLVDHFAVDSSNEDVMEPEPEPEPLAMLKVEDDEVSGRFTVGQNVHLTEESISERDELKISEGNAVVIVHIDRGNILVRDGSDNGEDSERETIYHHVSPDEIVAVNEPAEPVIGDDIIYTSPAGATRPASIIAVSQSDGETIYSLKFKDEPFFDFATRAEITILHAKTEAISLDQNFYFRESGCDATGTADESGGVIVLKGSKGKRKTSEGSKSRGHVRDDRIKMLEDGIAILDGDNIELVEDHYFPSLHRAASCLMGYNTNGQFWKTSDGKTYSQIRQERFSPEELFSVS